MEIKNFVAEKIKSCMSTFNSLTDEQKLEVLSSASDIFPELKTIHGTDEYFYMNLTPIMADRIEYIADNYFGYQIGILYDGEEEIVFNISLDESAASIIDKLSDRGIEVSRNYDVYTFSYRNREDFLYELLRIQCGCQRNRVLRAVRIKKLS